MVKSWERQKAEQAAVLASKLVIAAKDDRYGGQKARFIREHVDLGDTSLLVCLIFELADLVPDAYHHARATEDSLADYLLDHAAAARQATV